MNWRHLPHPPNTHTDAAESKPNLHTFLLVEMHKQHADIYTETKTPRTDGTALEKW